MATASLGSLVVSLGLDAAEYTRGLTKAQRDAQIARDEIVRTFEQAGSLLAGMGVAAAGAIGLITKASIDAADHLLDLNKATGVTVETLGGIGFAASQAGGDLDGTAASIGKLNLQIAKAASGEKDAVAGFNAMGIAVKDLRGNTKSTETVLGELAERFKSYGDAPEVAALANFAFGKSYLSILPLLRDGDKSLRDNIALYQQFGGVTTETAQQADRFNDTLGEIALVGGQLGRRLAVELLPPLQAVAGALLAMSKESQFFAIAAASVRTVFETLAVLGANVAFVFGQVGQTIGAYAAIVSRLAQLDVSGAKTIGEVYREQAEAARKELDQLERKILGMPTGRLDAGADPRSLGIGNESLTGNAPRLPGDAGKKGRNPSLTAEQVARLQLDAEEQAAKDSAEAWKFYEQSQLRQQKETADAYALQWKQVFEFIDAEQDRAIEAGKAFLKSQVEEVSEFAKEAQRNIQDAVGDTLVSALEGNFRSIGQLWQNLINRMLAQAVAARINEALFGKNFSGGLIGGALNGIFGTLGGGAPTVAPAAASVRASSVGGTTIINNNVAAGVSRNEVLTALQQFGSAADARVSQRLARAGV